MDDSNKKKHHSHNYTLYSFLKDDSFLVGDVFCMGDCTEECRQNYIRALEELSDAIKGHISLIKSLKKNEDGTLPSFYMGDVYALYEGDLDPEMNDPNIQDLFNVNLLDLNFPNLKKVSSNEKDNEENKK